MYILGIHTGHDASACLFQDGILLAFCKEERLSRVKNDGSFFDLRSVDEVLRIASVHRDQVDVVALTRMKLPQRSYMRTGEPLTMLRRKLLRRERDVNLVAQMIKTGKSAYELIDVGTLRKHLNVRSTTRIHFSNHHLCHVLASWYYVDWPQDALYVSCDGGGDGAQYSAYVPDPNELRCVLGGEETLLKSPQNSGASIGLAYAYCTEICGFIPNRHEGKLTGLAAFGTPTKAEKLLAQWSIAEDGTVHCQQQGAQQLRKYLQQLFAEERREDIAASIQQVTELLLLRWIETLRKLYPARYIGMSGGVFSNVRLNQKVAELPGVDEVFIFPAMGDEGLPVGACIDWLIRGDKKSLTRTRFKHLYYGQPYSGEELLDAAKKGPFKIELTNDGPRRTAELIHRGSVGAIYCGAMELGPRALGARTIVASPADRGVNDSINKRLQRTEFMPFAPVVRECDADDVFAINGCNRYACRFMTITTEVKDSWKDRIPAVVHVDGTARPQIIDRDDNPLYYDIITEFKGISGIPCVVNTSFNAHEEPIINTPQEALNALTDDRIDFLVCEQGLVFRA